MRYIILYIPGPYSYFCQKQFGYTRLEGKETIRGALADNNYYCIKNKLTCADTLLLFFQPAFQLPVTPPGG